jgi:hypothetical protein
MIPLGLAVLHAPESYTLKDFILKTLCVFKQTDLKSGDLTSVPRGTHELWTELKDSLAKRPILQGCCYRSRQQTTCNCCDNTASGGHIEGHSMLTGFGKSGGDTNNAKDNLSKVHHVAKRDMAR